MVQHEIALRQQEMTEKQKTEKIKSALTKRKREEREAVASGKGAFYLKVGGLLYCGEKQKIGERLTRFVRVAAEGQEEAGAAGQVPGPAGDRAAVQVHGQEAQENASKDHRWLPTQRK